MQANRHNFFICNPLQYNFLRMFPRVYFQLKQDAQKSSAEAGLTFIILSFMTDTVHLMDCFVLQLGETALIHASWEGNREIVKILIEAKASVNIRDKVRLDHTLTILMECLLQSGRQHFFFLQTGKTALFKATYGGWVKICQLLIDAGVHVDAQDFVSWENQPSCL